jgi:hypothetical protein
MPNIEAQIAQRKQREYNNQLHTLNTTTARFRKLARAQIQAKAIAKSQSTDTTPVPTNTPDAVIRRGAKALVMTPELCGLFYKINRQRKMLWMKEYKQGYEMLLG